MTVTIFSVEKVEGKVELKELFKNNKRLNVEFLENRKGVSANLSLLKRPMIKTLNERIWLLSNCKDLLEQKRIKILVKSRILNSSLADSTAAALFFAVIKFVFSLSDFSCYTNTLQSKEENTLTRKYSQY